VRDRPGSTATRQKSLRAICEKPSRKGRLRINDAVVILYGDDMPHFWETKKCGRIYLCMIKIDATFC